MTTALIMVGFLSAYALNPTVGTLEYRQYHEQIPHDLSGYDVFVAVADCAHIGAEATLVVGDMAYDALVFDCAGVADGGREWMHENAIVAEVDYWFWMENPDLIGSGLRVELHMEDE